MTFMGERRQSRGFATIDFETTGLVPEKHDRAIEVAVVHSDPDGTITGRWDTLINPGRDVGRTDIHGISAKEVLRAPMFEDIAGELVDLLSERVIVAHNASFDMRFLRAELGRCSYVVDPPHVCTMRLARRMLSGGCRLADCCAAFDIELTGAHRASVDAWATAELLGAFLNSPTDADWDSLHAATTPLMSMPGYRSPWLPRESSAVASASFVERIIDRVPDVSNSDEQAEYMALVEMCLLDRYLAEHEKDALVELTERLGMGRSTVRELHLRYFNALAAVAWGDGVITEDEHADLVTVARILELPDRAVDEVLAQGVPVSSPDVAAASASESRAFALVAGDRIVLTGDMSRPRSEWEEHLRRSGFEPWSAVTKNVRLVVAADPDSLSGKARKARDYGIPIVGEAWLIDALG